MARPIVSAPSPSATCRDRGRPDLSICIIAYKRRDALVQCLESVVNTVKNCSYEILICDNGSEDGTEKLLSARFPDAKLVVNRVNVGFAAANNQLIRISRGQYILLLNNDCLVAAGAVDTLVAFLRNRPEAAIVGARILLPDGTLQPSFQRVLEGPLINYTLNRFRRAKRQERILSSSLNADVKLKVMKEYVIEQGYDCTQEVAVVSGACLMVRREFVEKCGLLDQRYFMYLEDSDWCLRARRAGWKIFYCHQATVHHHHVHRASRSPEFAKILEPAYYQSQLIFCRKHFGLGQTCALALLLSLLVLGRITKGLLFLRLSADRRRWLTTLRIQLGLLGMFAKYLAAGLFDNRGPLLQTTKQRRDGTS